MKKLERKELTLRNIGLAIGGYLMVLFMVGLFGLPMLGDSNGVFEYETIVPIMAGLISLVFLLMDREAREINLREFGSE